MRFVARFPRAMLERRTASPPTTTARRAIASAGLVARPLPEARRGPPPAEEREFGRTFAPHMLWVRYREGGGWRAPEIVPFGPLDLSPASSALHYGDSAQGSDHVTPAAMLILL